MKSKTLTLLFQKLNSKDTESAKNLDKNRIKVEIENACELHLNEASEVFQFEVNPKELDHVITIIELGLINKYDIFQVERTIFNARLREVDLM
ncbi:hypothetical protein [Bacillus toyonensis]|uniref:hypothetical protein n=1 Tax=Bacillus toyonensis TaxID=155322 RepID=UPI000BF28D27|nr:hypothetical protein [Bacillus toyonensis]PGF05104.1 hypothetical protein COM61_01360 [Bacillus toyonensis]